MSELGDLSEVHADWTRIKADIDRNPLYALSVYENALRTARSELVRERLEHVFGDPLSFVTAGRDIQPEHMWDLLPEKYRAARSRDRKRLVKAIVDRLFECGIAAHHEQAPERELLAGVGATFETLVLTGTLDQQFVCKIAVEIGKKQAIPDAFRTSICEPLISALITVLRVGAPTTRDSAVEGLGAVLKSFPDAETRFTFTPLAGDEMNKGDPNINSEYSGRLDRRREVVLAVAGGVQARANHFRELGEALDEVEYPGFFKLESALTECADRLRGLTAICRQAADTDRAELTDRSIALLQRAARLVRIDESEDATTQSAFARYQESVFHTITVFLSRGAPPSELDAVVAGAIEAIPKTLIGEAPLCNGQARATVAIIRCAAHLLRLAREPKTATALEDLFQEVNPPLSLWSNPGIVEGCYRSLPLLLKNDKYNKWTIPALQTLFEHLAAPHDFNDLVETHHQMLAATSFRRILISLTESAHDEFLEAEADERRHKREIEIEVRTLLANPDAEHVRSVLQGSSRMPKQMPYGIAPAVVSATMFEREILVRSAALFKEWKTFSPPRQLLLTRILAAQLHVLSQDLKDVGRHPVLARLYDEMATITFSEAERQRRVWELLADLPPQPARAADADLQDFVEQSGIRRSTGRKPGQPHDDLPGYVLAMIDDSASERIAAAIAREIDLNIRHERLTDPAFDVAAPLYQVTLRGPHEAIFDHLFPRMALSADREIVLLFRKHVARVRACAEKRAAGDIDMNDLLDHTRDIVRDLHRRRRAGAAGSKTLNSLEAILKHFRILALGSWRLWAALTKEPQGRVAELFERLDKIADDTSTHYKAPAASDAHTNQREHLLPTYSDALAALRATVQDYIDCPINDSVSRERALRHATSIVTNVERGLLGEIGLQPPERVMLVSLMQYYRNVFERTLQWHCEEPRRCIENLEYSAFWHLFVINERQRSELSLAMQREREFVRREYDELFSETFVDARILERVKRLEGSIGKQPPCFSKQRAKFEAFFVEWTSADLEVTYLRTALQDRWPMWFRQAHKTITNLDKIGGVILVPFVIAAIFDALGFDGFEGVGFFAVAAILVALALASFTPALHTVISALKRWIRKDADDDSRPEYRFQSFLPRLAHLIAVPIALLVDFEHSYFFPMKASSWSLLLLMTLAYLTTRYFVQREIVDRDRRSSTADLLEERPKMRQIVAVALAHAFGIATLLSIIFAGSELRDHQEERTPTAVASALSLSEVMSLAGDHKWSEAMNGFMDWTVNRFDEVPKNHHWRRFLGIIPRDVSFDLGRLLPFLPRSIRSHLQFVYYPTLILTWTSMGLFFGVFLEGFLKGERLRGEIRQRREPLAEGVGVERTVESPPRR